MDEGLELQREWRQIVLSKLESLERGQKAVEEKLVDFTVNAVRLEDYERLELRVRDLETTKIKVLAVWAVIQSLSIGIAWLVTTLLKS